VTKIIGLNRTSDASFCCLDHSDIDVLIRKERLNGTKHAWGSLGDLPMYLRAFQSSIDQVDAVIQCFSSDDERGRIEAYEAELRSYLPIHENAFIGEISHHFAHAYSAFYPSNFSDAAILIADNRGSPQELVGNTGLVRSGLGFGALEVITAYEARDGKISQIAKQWWNRDPRAPAGLGMLYSAASKTVFGRDNREGALMGLAALGDPSRLKLPPLEVDGIAVWIPPEWTTIFADTERFSFFRNAKGQFSDCADLAAATQNVFEAALVAVTRNLRQTTGMRRLVYAGGCALNCSANTQLARQWGFENLFIPPACDDAGTSLGCALFGLESLGGDPSVVQWRTDYLGPAYELDAEAISSAAADHGLRCQRPPDLAAFVSEEISRGELVALFQGRSESGARALGNRSILADSRYEAIRTFINTSVKRREWFRPLAPVVRNEDARIYFELEGPSQFMQLTSRVRPEWRSRLAAVCHVDGSARVQTLTHEQNPFLHSVLGRFAERTSIGVLLNTSFNGREKPIVETVNDALGTFCEMPIRWLVIPPLLIGPRLAGRSPLSS
jgi:carbamoyltransferase